MATIDRIDEQEQLAAAIKKRRQPLAMAARTLPGVGIAPMAGASHVPQPKPPTFGIGTYMKEAPVQQPIAALAAGIPKAQNTQPLAALPDPSSVLAAQQRPLAPKPQSMDAATMQPSIAQPAPQPANVIPAANVAALDPQTARDLSAAKAANTDEYGDAPGYRGPLAPGRGIAGDFDFATNAARDFAARSSDPRERAKVPGLVAAITQRDADARGDASIANANATTDSNARSLLSAAQGTEAKARASSLTELLPSEKALKGSQTAENLGRTARDLAATSNTLALQPGAVQAQTAANTLAGLDVKGRQRVEDIGSKIAAATKPEDINKLGAQLLALLGKSKPEEYQVAHAAGGTDAQGAKSPDNIVIVNKATGKAEVVPLGAANGPTPPENHVLALKQNPNMAKDFDAKYGQGAAAKYLKG